MVLYLQSIELSPQNIICHRVLLPVPLLPVLQYYLKKKKKNSHLGIKSTHSPKKNFKKSKSHLESSLQIILVPLGHLFLGAKPFCQLPTGAGDIDQYTLGLASTVFCFK